MLTKIKNIISNKTTNPTSYEEWKNWALARDQETGMAAWKTEEESNLYDYQEIRLRLKTLRAFRTKGDDQGLLFALNEGVHGNMGGMGNAKLYNQALSGTKQLIVDYVDEISDALLHLAIDADSTISFEERLDFFRRASHCFGRSALMLSGGGQLGNFHLGVLKTLVQQDILPNVISGSSAGSVFAALMGTRTNKELIAYMALDNLKEVIEMETRVFDTMYKKRDSISEEELKKTLERLIPNMTFQEAFEKTGRKINISIAPHEAHQKSRLLNSIASPNVLIRSAVMASCAVPGVFPPVTLQAKNKDGKVQAYLPSRKWVDGSMSNDLPSKRLARLYGVNHFIVSLTNPVVLPFVRDPSTQNDFLAATRKLSVAILKETSQFNYFIASKFFKYNKNLALIANNLNSVVQQEYTGDINIIADFSVLNPRQLLSALTPEELAELIFNGEQATWPKVEAIRVTTKIGRILDKILAKYEQIEMDSARRTITKKENKRKKKRTIG